jgi:hypothetical protein
MTLSDTEQKAYLALAQNVADKVGSHLGLCREAASAVGFIANLHQGADLVFQNAVVHGASIACKESCNFCCAIRVHALDPEIFWVVRGIRTQRPGEQAQILSRLREYVEKRRLDTGYRLCINCAFLVERRCSIYPDRPAVCRKAHSLSVADCEKGSNTIPQNLDLVVQAEILMKGVAMGYASRLLRAAPRDFCAAVLHALSSDDAEQRWFQGEDVFADIA